MRVCVSKKHDFEVPTRGLFSNRLCRSPASMSQRGVIVIARSENSPPDGYDVNPSSWMVGREKLLMLCMCHVFDG